MRAPSGRRRGGQPGNHNRLKHGLYARQLPIAHTLRLERLGVNRHELDIAVARARLMTLLNKQSAAGADDFLSYERAIQHYLIHIGRLIHRNMHMRRETAIPPHQLRELLDMLEEQDTHFLP